MSFKDEDYKLVSSYEGYGSKYSIGMKVLFAGLDLTEDEKYIIRDYAEKARRAVLLHRDKETGAAERERVKETLISCFRKRVIHVKQIENGYSSDYVNSPWLVVTTTVGPITIGWRKRVIQIDWNQSDVTEWAHELFPQENVTKERRLIHAWTLDKAAEYLDVILSCEPFNPQPKGSQ